MIYVLLIAQKIQLFNNFTTRQTSAFVTKPANTANSHCLALNLNVLNVSILATIFSAAFV